MLRRIWGKRPVDASGIPAPETVFAQSGLDVVPTPSRTRSRSRSRTHSRSPGDRLRVSSTVVGNSGGDEIHAGAAGEGCIEQCHLEEAGAGNAPLQSMVAAHVEAPPGRSSAGGHRASLASRARRSCSGPPERLTRARRSLAAASRRSYAHREFENPEAETCWLSCCFQSLWHSVVFHTTFEQHLASTLYAPEPEERILAALQQTWKKYRVEQEGDMNEKADAGDSNAAAADGGSREPDGKGPIEGGMASTVPGHLSQEQQQQSQECLVPASDLAEAFGEGYGDMSEAFALIMEELSQSPNPAAVGLADLMVVVPISLMGDSWPTPALAWAQVEEWQVMSSPLIAVDISSDNPTKESSEYLAKLWVPVASPGSAVNPEVAQPLPSMAAADFGREHRLVALVCFMWNVQHYVAFCRRQRDPTRCLFFNDLPELTSGAPKEVEWCQVPSMCGQYSLTPRLALYESTVASEKQTTKPETDGH
mmetsp:Transcript_31324/g.70453  ORF Transcript_31324/g.70453 Transcript_31324/m.70453 type:complete len:479 (-) Transcript_31324:59-1495(-)